MVDLVKFDEVICLTVGYSTENEKMDRKKITQQFLDEGKMVKICGQYFPNSPKNPGTGKFSTLRNMKSSENGVIVMGAAKCGSHLVMSILVKGLI